MTNKFMESRYEPRVDTELRWDDWEYMYHPTVMELEKLERGSVVINRSSNGIPRIFLKLSPSIDIQRCAAEFGLSIDELRDTGRLGDESKDELCLWVGEDGVRRTTGTMFIHLEGQELVVFNPQLEYLQTISSNGTRAPRRQISWMGR